MLNIAVYNDDKTANDLLCKQIKKFGKYYHIEAFAYTFTNGEKLVNSGKKYDIILLGIGYHPERDLYVGYCIRKADRQVKIIFLSYLECFMKQALSVHAFAYLMKPLQVKELFNVLYDALLFNNDRKEKMPIVKFHLANGMKPFFVGDITYFEYCNRNVLIHDCKNHTYEIRGEKISNIACMMKSYHFEVPHKSFVVNMFQIKGIKGYEILTNNGKILPLSQKNSKNFRKIWINLCKNKGLK